MIMKLYDESLNFNNLCVQLIYFNNAAGLLKK